MGHKTITAVRAHLNSYSYSGFIWQVRETTTDYCEATFSANYFIEQKHCCDTKAWYMNYRNLFAKSLWTIKLTSELLYTCVFKIFALVLIAQ